MVKKEEFSIRKIIDIFLPSAVTRVETFFTRWLKKPEDSRGGTGTGFFYKNKKGENFLITNAHMFYDKDENYFPDKVLFYVWSKKTMQAMPIILDLRKGKKTVG